jgi:hypothetical protein
MLTVSLQSLSTFISLTLISCSLSVLTNNSLGGNILTKVDDLRVEAMHAAIQQFIALREQKTNYRPSRRSS